MLQDLARLARVGDPHAWGRLSGCQIVAGAQELSVGTRKKSRYDIYIYIYMCSGRGVVMVPDHPHADIAMD